MSKEIYNSIFQQEIRDLIELKRALGFSYEAEAGSCDALTLFYAGMLCLKNISPKSCAIYGVKKNL